MEHSWIVKGCLIWTKVRK